MMMQSSMDVGEDGSLSLLLRAVTASRPLEVQRQRTCYRRRRRIDQRALKEIGDRLGAVRRPMT
jgi:hypothetical protein